jgi:hypothetical protein
MVRIVGGVLALLLAMPALWAEDKPKDKDKPATPAEQQYKALRAEYQKAQSAYQDALRAAKTPEERQKVVREKNPSPKLASQFVTLAEKYPKDPVAVDALIWVITNRFGPSPTGKTEARTRAIALLASDHVQSEKLGRVCQSLAFGLDQENETLLRAVLEKN